MSEHHNGWDISLLRAIQKVMDQMGSLHYSISFLKWLVNLVTAGDS